MGTDKQVGQFREDTSEDELGRERKDGAGRGSEKYKGQALLQQAGDPLEPAIMSWLQAKDGRSQSKWTAKRYAVTLRRFRRDLRSRGYDLDSQEEIVAAFAQQWAATPWDQSRRHQVSAATHNVRLAIISSFYTYAQRHRFHIVASNPIEMLDRRPEQVYAKGQPFDRQAVERSLAAIDRESLEGKRDYALLCVAFTTGRQRAELASLRWKDLSFGGSVTQPTITMSISAKGGTVMQDQLEPAVAEALLAYLGTLYGPGMLSGALPPDSPIWQSCTPKHYEQIVPLGEQGIANIFARHLSSSRVQRSRHTFARQMVQSGAPISALQARLGHANLGTTGTYVSELGGSENPYVGILVRRFGIVSASLDPEQRA